MTELLKLNFHCRKCGDRFEAEPSATVDCPEREWQPAEYFADCPSCGAQAAQAAWEVNLAKAHAHATGPRTPDGLAAATKRLSGHPTPEEAKRTRFNALKHGAFAGTALYWPSRPGAYAECDTCEHFNRGCDIRPPPGRKNPLGCLKKSELMMQFQIAFDAGDPTMLKQHAATMQAAVFHMVNDMIRTVIRDGMTLRTPEWQFDKDGVLHVATYTDGMGEERTIEKVEAHPLLKYVIEYMNRNGMTLPDSGMTMKVKDEQENIRGFLDADNAKAESALEFQERATKALEGLAGLVERSQQRKLQDPVLIEHQTQEHSDGQ